MDSKNELYDLKREKRELDTFLSTIAEAETAAPPPIKGAVQTKEALSSLAENKSAPEAAHREPSGLKLEMPAVKPEAASRQPSHKERVFTPSENEFIPKFTDTISSKPTDHTSPKQEVSSSFLPPSEGKKTEPLPKTTSAQDAKPLENLKTMTRIGGTAQSDEQMVAETPPPEEKKITAEPEPEKKTEKVDAYDFAPAKRGISKWTWISLILIIALLVGYFWLYPSFKSDQGAISSSVKEVKLINVRQRLVHNAALGKSIRVIEGIAENSALNPISKIKIVANLYDSKGSLLASVESFGGNIIIDEKLERLSAAELLSALKDGKTSEDSIPPKGQIPFMIVFTNEPAGVNKLSVLPVGFKKQ